MRLPHHPNAAGRAERRRSGCGGWNRRPPRARVLLGAAGLALTACGSSPASPTILDTEKIERAIEQSSLAQRGIRVQVSCPSGVHQTKGLVFSCMAVYRGGGSQFVVTETDGAGHVHYEAR